MSELHQAIEQTDIAAINATLRNYKVDAGVPSDPSYTLIALSSHCAYRVETGQRTRFAEIEKLERELRSEVMARRQRNGLASDGMLRVIADPWPLIEIDSPVDHLLDLPDGELPLGLDKCAGSIGVSYDFRSGCVKEKLDLTRDAESHTGVFALSGHGKSSVMRAALLTMLYTTPPSELGVILIDLKNTDLVPFKNVPHAITFAGDNESAIAALTYAERVRTERVANQGAFDFRLLIVIDELAQLCGVTKPRYKEVQAMLADIMTTGRSMGINVFAATQYPTAEAVGAGVARAFTQRIVGRVDSSSAAVFASGRSESGADKLKRPGSFLRIGAGDPQRFQSYYSDPDRDPESAYLVQKWLGKIQERWSGQIAPASFEGPRQTKMTEEPESDPIEELADTIEPLWLENASKGQMARHAGFSQYGGGYAAKIDQAIELLRGRASTTTKATTTGRSAGLPVAVAAEMATP